MAYIYRSNSSASGTTATISAWVKSVDTSVDAGIFQFKSSSNTISFYTNPVLKFRVYTSGSYSTGDLVSNDKSFRDFYAWWHLVATIDTTNATSGDRLRVYINGERQTNFSTETYPSQNQSYAQLVSGNFELGKYGSTDRPTYLAHVHYCDGYAYNVDSFGSTDATTGEWKINTAPNVQYGTNGVFLKFGNAGALGTDSSGNNNTMSISGTPIQTQDNPSNNFAVLNPIINPDPGNRATYTVGNTKGNTNSAGHISGLSTFAVNEGKFYCESKSGSSGTGHVFGVLDAERYIAATDPQDFSGIYGVSSNGTRYVAGTQTGSWGGSYTYGNVMGLALDMDASPPKLHIHYNGSYCNGSGSYNQTFANSVPITLAADKNYLFFFGDNTSSGTYDHQVNFGNGYFGTTAISSEGTNASGHGKFEYDVPTGYTALCTKGLNE